ncbi:MAG: DMT family transporter [Burkholderiales bacterium]
MLPAATRTPAQAGIALAALLAGATCIAPSPLWVRLMWKQRPRGAFLAGLVTALTGVTMLVETSATLSSTALAGDALGVVTAMFYAWYLLAVKRLRDFGAATLQLMAVTTTITAALLLPVALVSGEQMLPVTAQGWLTLIGLALVSHAAGQGLIAYALARLPAAFSSASLLFQPVMAGGGFTWAILSEALAPVQIADGIVVLLGICLSRRGSS